MKPDPYSIDRYDTSHMDDVDRRGFVKILESLRNAGKPAPAGAPPSRNAVARRMEAQFMREWLEFQGIAIPW